MKFLKNRRNRICISLAAALIFTARPATAWWGIMYPEFCFSETDEKKEKKQEEVQEVKISFWLAKHLNW